MPPTRISRQIEYPAYLNLTRVWEDAAADVDENENGAASEASIEVTDVDRRHATKLYQMQEEDAVGAVHAESQLVLVFAAVLLVLGSVCG
jgi:hypothetical protein